MGYHGTMSLHCCMSPSSCCTAKQDATYSEHTIMHIFTLGMYMFNLEWYCFCMYTWNVCQCIGISLHPSTTKGDNAVKLSPAVSMPASLSTALAASLPARPPASSAPGCFWVQAFITTFNDIAFVLPLFVPSVAFCSQLHWQPHRQLHCQLCCSACWRPA